LTNAARGGGNITLEELISSAERVEKGIALTPELDMALYHGSAVISRCNSTQQPCC
jgi:serine/threonine-protein kinase HipA